MDNSGHCDSIICFANGYHWRDVWYTGIIELSFCYLNLWWITLNYMNQCGSIIILTKSWLTCLSNCWVWSGTWQLLKKLTFNMKLKRFFALIYAWVKFSSWTRALRLLSEREFVLDTNTLAIFSHTVGLAGVMSQSLAVENNSDTTHGCFSHQLFSFWVEDVTIFWWLDLEY